MVKIVSWAEHTWTSGAFAGAGEFKEASPHPITAATQIPVTESPAVAEGMEGTHAHPIEAATQTPTAGTIPQHVEGTHPHPAEAPTLTPATETTEAPAVPKPMGGTHPHAIALPTPPASQEPAREVPLEDLPATVQGTPEEATPPPGTTTHAPVYASYKSQPGEVVTRNYSSTQSSESTQTRTTTSGLPAAAVAVPAGLAAGAAAGVAGVFAAGAGDKKGEASLVLEVHLE